MVQDLAAAGGKAMTPIRIYKVNTERDGILSFNHYHVSATSYEQAIAKAKMRFEKSERVQDVELVAEASDD